jgi:hypothetical protein
MAEQKIGSTLQLAQELVNHLPKELKEMDDELKKLILIAEDGQDPMVEIEIIDLLSSQEITRRLMREQINLQSGQRDLTLGGDSFTGTPGWVGAGLAGKQGWIPPSLKWICPKSTCSHWMLVIQEGEDPPTCEQHNIEMVRERKKKG